MGKSKEKRERELKEYKEYFEKNELNLFDSHCHLDDEAFNNDRNLVIEDIKKHGIKKLVTAGYSLAGSEKAVELSKKYDFIYSTIGISPNDIPENKKDLEEDIEKLKNIYSNYMQYISTKGKRKIVAIGEIGLDYYWNKENKQLQKMAFIEQIKLANEWGLPIQIHSRDAVMDTLQIIKEHKVKNKGIFHCCQFNRELVKEALKFGYYISFAGPTTFKNANSSEIINMVPDNKFLVETDSPYLSPEPLRGTRNIPENVKYILKRIAEVKNKDFQELQKLAYNNACVIFKIEDA